MGSISIWQLLIILAIVLLLFGTKKLRNIGSDLGGAIKGFRKAVTDGEEGKDKSAEGDTKELEEGQEGDVIEGEARTEEKSKQQDRA